MKGTTRLFITLGLLVSFPFLLQARTETLSLDGMLSLDGTWSFRMDTEDVGLREGWYKQPFQESVVLPGSMPENRKGFVPDLKTQWTASLYDSSFYFNLAWEKYRQPGRIKFPFFLTPERHYVGAAWYQREVVVPENWRGQRVVLSLERAHTETQVWLDGRYVGKDSSLCVPQVFELGSELTPGKHSLVLRVNNRIQSANVGQDSHSLTDQTQGNWNGVVGSLQLSVSPNVYLDDIQVFPNLSTRTANVRVRLENKSGKAIKRVLKWEATAYNTAVSHRIIEQSRTVTVPDTGLVIDLPLHLGDGMQTWDEFHPTLYRLKATLLTGNAVNDSLAVSFGMREIVAKGKWFYVNGRKVQLRGTVENCCFPATGYPPMDVASWERIFNLCKQYGLNHMRFHSWCPPKAAFEAADLVGIYLQVEGPSWPNHGSSLGDGHPIDGFLMDEISRIVHTYGNHPSFVLLACGNEPRGRWVAWATRFVNFWKQTDTRRLYTGASVGGSWAWVPVNQFHVKAGVRGLSWDKQPESMSDYREKIDTVSVPYVSHEAGQWCAFPNFDEIRKYTGVNKALNFELFKEDLTDHDMGDLAHDFLMASGRLQVLSYKHEIEKHLRTPNYAGFQLLSLNDYSGQGTALVGVLDVFWEEKGYCTAADFRQFCGPVVPLIRTPSFVLTADKRLVAQAELSYFGENAYQVVQPSWTLTDELGRVVATGRFPEKAVEPGTNIPLGTVDVDLSFVSRPTRLTLKVSVAPCEAANSWDFHVYPTTVALPDTGDVRIFHEWNRALETTLETGGKVLLLCDGRVEYGKDVVQTLAPVFWNTSWFKMRPPHTTGVLINDHHPVFKDFPTRSYTDLSWWELVQRTQVMQLTEFPAGFQPIVQPIDTWFLNRKLGMLFEAKVGKGRLMVCSMNLDHNHNKRPVARQLYVSVLNYLRSEKFRPVFTVEANTIKRLLLQPAQRTSFFSTDSPDELMTAPK